MTDDTEKLLIFNRLQKLLKELHAHKHTIVVCRMVDYDYGDTVREDSRWHTDELNEALTQIRDFGEGAK